MKFGKELSSQMVPEWQQAYISYDYLKSLLKEIIKLKHKTNPLSPPHHAVSGEGLSRKMTYIEHLAVLSKRQEGKDKAPVKSILL